MGPRWAHGPALLLCIAVATASSADFYALLDVRDDATPSQIRKAYRKKALELHPDKQPEENREEAAEKFSQVAHAYEVLSDEEERRRYDALSPEERAGRSGHRGPSSVVVRNYADDLMYIAVRFPAGTFDMRVTRKRTYQEQTVTVTATLSLADVVTGKNLSFSAPLRRTCPHCGGSGARSQEEVQECPACTGTGYRMHVHRGASGAFLQGFNTSCDLCEGHGSRPTAPCPVCEGQRYTTAEAEHTVAIPAGAPAGYQIRLGGHGHSRPLYEAGDVLVVVMHAPHPDFRAEDAVLVGDLEVGIIESLLGFERTVAHPNGTAIPVRSSDVVASGHTLVVPGAGLPGVGGGEWGDMLLNVRVAFPARLSPWQRTRLREIMGEEEVRMLEDVLKLGRVTRLMREFAQAGPAAEAEWSGACPIPAPARGPTCPVDLRWWWRWGAVSPRDSA